MAGTYPLVPVSPFSSTNFGSQLGNFTDPASQPGPNPLSLGSVIFATSEVPQQLEFSQSTAIHSTRLIGGSLTTVSFGVYPDPVTWTGRIYGQNVESRLTSLRQLHRAQAEILIQYRTERHYGIISEFKATRLTVDAEYSITVQVTRDANGSISSAAPVALDTQISALTTAASEQASSIALIDAAGAIPLQQAVTNVKGTLATAGPVAQLTGSSLTSVLNTTTASSAAANTYLAGLSPSASQFVTASQLVTSFSLIAKNIGIGQSLMTGQFLGGSLAEIAAIHYGNADIAPLLASANGIAGIRLPPGVLTTIKFPPFPTSSASSAAASNTAAPNAGSFGTY
jgi:hypothetical protein